MSVIWHVLFCKHICYGSYCFRQVVFQYFASLEGEKKMPPWVGLPILSFWDVKSLLDAAARKIFRNSTSVTTYYRKTFQKQMWWLTQALAGLWHKERPAPLVKKTCRPAQPTGRASRGRDMTWSEDHLVLPQRQEERCYSVFLRYKQLTMSTLWSFPNLLSAVDICISDDRKCSFSKDTSTHWITLIQVSL